MINKIKTILFISLCSTLCMFLFEPSISYGGSIEIRWNKNTEPDLSGYYLYYGTSTGNYDVSLPIEAHITSYEITGLTEGAMYYIALTAHDFSNNESEKSQEISGIALPSNSTSKPTGTITINDGQNLTSSSNVLLSLSATSGNGEPFDTNGMMSFSNDNQEWSDPEPFETEKIWTLTPGEGNKTVYVLFRDASGNWMTVPAHDEIYYDDTYNTCVQSKQLRASSISASSESLPFFAKENAIDGDPSTSWSTILRLFQKDEYFTMDLGEIKNITSLSMYSSRIFGTDFFPTNFQIQVSNDNINWVDMNTIQGYTRPLDEGSPDNWQYNGLACRFLRVSISKCRTFLFFFRVAQIAEIELYGCDRDVDEPLIAGEKKTIGEDVYPTYSPAGERNPIEQQVPGIPGKPVIKFLN